jgi:hypothetical protein
MKEPGRDCLPVPLMLGVALMWLLATLSAVLLWHWAPPIIDASYGTGHQPFEILGLTLSIAAIGSVALFVKRRTPNDWIVSGLWLLPVMAVIHQVSEYATPSWDWRCYVGAAEAVAAGLSPYSDCYIYPPGFAAALSAIYPVFEQLGETIGFSGPKQWMLVFFFWHSGQVLMVALTAFLLHRLARREGLSGWLAVLLIAGLLVVNAPLDRTIRHNQVNLIVLNLILLGLDRLRGRPAAAGALIGLAAHIKLLPAVLVVGLAIERRWRAVVGLGAAALGIFLVQLSIGDGVGLWAEFFATAPQFVQGEYFRDNSLTGLMFNLVRVPIDLAGGNIVGFAKPLRVLGMVASLAVVTWLSSGIRSDPDPDRLGAQCMGLMLLVSPVAWEHHFVWALPLAVVAVARAGTQQPGRVALGAFLIFCLPTFDVFPLSYHRLAGLILLMRAVGGSQPTEDRSG